MGRRETIQQFIKLEDFSILRLEEQELYKFLYEKDITKSKIDELEPELKRLKARYKELQDPGLAKMLGISKQWVFTRRTHLLNKIKRCLVKK